MRRSDSRPDTSAGTRLAALEAANPEWSPWLGLLRRLGDTLSRPCPCSVEPGERPADAPLLDGATVSVGAAFMPPDAGGTAFTPPVDPAAHAALIPVFVAAREAVEPEIPLHWPHGYCPVCAAWPVLAELRGLDRSRWLRCGRCGAGWTIPWLRCAFCGERDHERLGSLVPEEGGDLRQVATCETCRGYLKSVQTLQPLPHFELLLLDLETVELDLAAESRGFARRGDSGYAMRLRIETRGVS